MLQKLRTSFGRPHEQSEHFQVVPQTSPETPRNVSRPARGLVEKSFLPTSAAGSMETWSRRRERRPRRGVGGGLGEGTGEGERVLRVGGSSVSFLEANGASSLEEDRVRGRFDISREEGGREGCGPTKQETRVVGN